MREDDEIKRSALLIATLAAFLTPFMVSSINIALPAIGHEFHMSALALSWVPTAYLLSAAVFLVPFGRIADLYGRKKIFTVGIAVYTLAACLLALSPSAAFLIGFRVIEGFGGALIFGTGIAIVTSVFPQAERGKVLGINVAAVYLGLSLGPTFGGFLTQHLGWRSIFLTNVPLGLFILFLLFTKLPGEWIGARGERFDLAGSLIYAVALVTLMSGLSRLAERTGMGLLLIGLAGLIAFARWEMQTPAPVLNLGLFRKNAAFAFSNLAALINYSATFSVTFLMSLYLQYVQGLSAEHAGVILVAQPLVMALFSPMAGRLSDTHEPRIVASLGMGITAAGLFLFTCIGRNTHLGFVIAGLVLLGFGFALFSSPNTNAVMSSIDKQFYGVGSAILGTMRLTGQMFSMGIAMVVFALRIGSARITAGNHPLFLASMHTAFMISAVLCVAGVFASLARGKVR